MKIALIAAGAITAATFANSSEASAASTNFAFTVGGPQGFVQISAPGKHHGQKYYKKRAKKRAKQHKRNRRAWKKYNRNRYTVPGYAYGYRAPYAAAPVRAYGYCKSPYQIRQKLRHRGWYGTSVIKLTPRFAVMRSHRHGIPYRLKVQRCTGYVAKVTPIGGYISGRYY